MAPTISLSSNSFGFIPICFWCKKRARIFQRIRPKMDRLGSSSSAPNNRERDYHNDSRHVTSVLLWKWWVTHLQALRIWVFAGEMIKVSLKRGKSDHLVLINAKNQPRKPTYCITPETQREYRFTPHPCPRHAYKIV